jgi:hypothetical protein
MVYSAALKNRLTAALKKYKPADALKKSFDILT